MNALTKKTLRGAISRIVEASLDKNVFNLCRVKLMPDTEANGDGPTKKIVIEAHVNRIKELEECLAWLEPPAVEVKALLLSRIERGLYNIEDDLRRAEHQFGRLTKAELRKPYCENEKSPTEILKKYEQLKCTAQSALLWLQQQ